MMLRYEFFFAVPIHSNTKEEHFPNLYNDEDNFFSPVIQIHLYQPGDGRGSGIVIRTALLYPDTDRWDRGIGR